MASPLFRLPDVGRVALLPDGRKLGFAEYGDPGGRPVFFFHGTPGSRMFLPPYSPAAAKLGLRLIAPERPGFGLSDFQPGRTLLNWPADVALLADALHIEQFAAIGYSGGGPYLLACAAKLPQRLTRGVLISSMAPLDAPTLLSELSLNRRLQYRLLKLAPYRLTRQILQVYARRAKYHPEKIVPLIQRHLPPQARLDLEDPVLAASIRSDAVEAYHAGPEAAAWDFKLLGHSWGFELSTIQTPLHIWHGEQDTNVPVAMAHYLERQVANGQATYCAGDTHSSIFRHWPEMLSAL